MNTEALKPRDGEQLADWINRTRPATAPEVQGQPTFKNGGFAWSVAGWTVGMEGGDGEGTTVIFWEAPEGHVAVWYSLNTEGEQEASIEGCEDVAPAWPAVA